MTNAILCPAHQDHTGHQQCAERLPASGNRRNNFSIRLLGVLPQNAKNKISGGIALFGCLNIIKIPPSIPNHADRIGCAEGGRF